MTEIYGKKFSREPPAEGDLSSRYQLRRDPRWEVRPGPAGWLVALDGTVVSRGAFPQMRDAMAACISAQAVLVP